MKNIGLFLKAVVLTPFVIASAWVLFILSYMMVPILILTSVFIVLKAKDEEEDDEEPFSNRRRR